MSGKKVYEEYVLNTYKEIAEHYDKTRTKPWREVRSFIDSIPEGSILLDAGCGNGYNAKYAVSKSIYTVSMDIVREMVSIAKSNSAGNFFVQGDIRNMPFRNNAFHSSISIAVLHHFDIDDALRAIRELKRVTYGKTLVSVWKRGIALTEKYTDAEGNALVPWKAGAGELRYYHLYTMEEFRNLFDKAGIKDFTVFENEKNLFCIY